jgi:hypothetical protein
MNNAAAKKLMFKQQMDQHNCKTDLIDVLNFASVNLPTTGLK